MKRKHVTFAWILFFCLMLLCPAKNMNAQEVIQKAVELNVGKDETERRITWYCNEKEPGVLQYGIKEGEEFPEQYKEVTASVSETNDKSFYSNKATFTDLEPEQEYVYRLVNGSVVSKTYSFKTTSTGDFTFLAAGDPQIGGGELETDVANWENTLNKSMEAFPEAAFLVTMGDQVNVADDESLYDGLLSPSLLTSLPLATSIGNHDSESEAYTQHFNNPNVTAYGQTPAGSSYWYVYNDVLFMHMNSNSKNTKEHQKFIENAMKSNPDVKWRILIFHHSIFSTTNHAEQKHIATKKEDYVPMITEFQPDLVLMGHDHVYVRTYMMDGTTPMKSSVTETAITDADGILYLTLNSSSGSKYYYPSKEYDYAAMDCQNDTPHITSVRVTDSSLSVDTYMVTDTLALLDSYQLNRSNKAKANMVYQLKAQLTGYDDIKLSWTKGADADGYEIAYKKHSAAKYNKVIEVTDTTYNISNLADGTKYDFKVRPYSLENGQKIYGKARTTTITTLKRAGKPTVTATSTKLKIKWKKVTGATGYQISITRNANRTKVTKTTKSVSKNVKKTSLKNGKTYYIKIRAYKKVGKTIVYAPWSKARKYVNRIK